jgi:RES domain-containing protein
LRITAYRISKTAFAATLWSGIGARDFGGRWNSKGVAVVYTSESRALAAMEQLVHLVTPRVLRGYVVAGITFDDADAQRITPATLPTDWDNPVAPPALKMIGDNWVAALRYPVLAVPSAVISGEWNYLFNPVHPAFAAHVKSGPMPFVYDPRLG